MALPTSDQTRWHSTLALTFPHSQLQRRFELVLITELLDASLVLLKYRLCLDWDDIVAFRHNARPPWLRSAATHNVTLRRQLRHHLAADSALYHHFYQRLRQALRDYGVAHIRAGLTVLRQRVLYWAERDVWMCSRLFSHEITYTEHLKMEQEWEAHRVKYWDKIAAYKG